MTTTEINYKGTDYTCRIVTSNEGESLIIGGLELLDALMPYPITDKCNGFADKEAERVDEEIFYYTSESDLKLPDNEYRSQIPTLRLACNFSVCICSQVS